MVDVCSSCGQADALRGLRCPVVTQHGGDGDGGKPCGHQFCVPCMRRFTVLRLRRRIWPMPCPKRLDDACAAVFARDTLIGVFGEESQDIIEVGVPTLPCRTVPVAQPGQGRSPNNQQLQSCTVLTSLHKRRKDTGNSLRLGVWCYERTSHVQRYTFSTRQAPAYGTRTY